MPQSRQVPPASPHTGAAVAPAPQPLLERPGIRPAGMRQVLRDLSLPHASNGVIGLIFACSAHSGQQAFVTAFATAFTLGSLVTFVVTISGMSLFNIHPAFWALVIGYSVSRLLERADHARS